MVAYVPYLKYLGEEARNPFRVEEVALQIKANGYYQHVKEWRISTEMSSRVEPVKSDGMHVMLRPQYHWTDQKLHVHVFTCVLSYLLARLLHIRAQQTIGYTRSMEQLLDTLAQVRRVNIVRSTQKTRRSRHISTRRCGSRRRHAHRSPKSPSLVYTETPRIPAQLQPLISCLPYSAVKSR